MAEVWGWERFFQELETFLTAANREIESASLAYAQFVEERLQICLQALFNLLNYFEASQIQDDLGMLQVRATLLELSYIVFGEAGWMR